MYLETLLLVQVSPEAVDARSGAAVQAADTGRKGAISHGPLSEVNREELQTFPATMDQRASGTVGEVRSPRSFGCCPVDTRRARYHVEKSTGHSTSRKNSDLLGSAVL
jgi:hypothetical protein